MERKQMEISYLLTVLLSMRLNKLPCLQIFFKIRMLLFVALKRLLFEKFEWIKYLGMYHVGTCRILSFFKKISCSWKTKGKDVMVNLVAQCPKFHGSEATEEMMMWRPSKKQTLFSIKVHALSYAAKHF